MGDEEFRIIISAVEQASDDIKKAQASLKNLATETKKTADAQTGLGKAMGGAKQFAEGLGVSLPTLGVAALGAAALKAGEYVLGAAADTAAYAEEVRQLGMAIGATPEEASKLIQAADDMGISFSQLETAMKGAIRKGVEPTIAGMGQLADQYLAIQDPIERTKFLMDNFGRSGADLQRLMELGADGIRELGDEIEGTARLMDQDALDAAEKYRLAQDALGDSFEDIKMTIGRAFIPALADAANAVSDFMNRERELQTEQRKTSDFILETATSYEEYAAQMTAFAESQHLVVRATEDGIQAFDTSSGLANKLAENVDILSEAEYELYLRNIYLAASYEANKKPIEDFSEAIDDTTQAMDDLHAAMNGKLGPAIEDFKTKSEELTAKLEEQRAKAKELEGIQYKTPEQQAELDGLQEEIQATKDEMNKYADEHAEATGRILFDILQQKLATNDVRTEVSEFTTEELALLSGLAEQWGLVDDATVTASLGMDAAMKAFAEGNIRLAMAIITNMYNKLTGMPTDISVNFKINVSGTIPNVGATVGGTGGTKAVPKGPGGSVAPPPPSSNSGPGGATGLDIIVPPGYYYDNYPIRAQSGERVTITPAGKEDSEKVVNNYNMTINTSAPVENIVADFALMRSLALGG